MYTLKECQDIIDRQLSGMIMPEKPALLYEPIKYVIGSEGKRIRPSLTLLACNLFTDIIDASVYPALAVELFHNFTLLHDDIMDNSDMRRGQPTVHQKWNNNVAILSGDAMLIKAYEYLSKCSVSILSEVLAIFNKTALEVCEGQQFDMDFETDTKVTVSDYLKMIELKTSVLIAASLKIGAICGRAGEKDAELLYQFGRNLGIAFQLQDDLLDVYADPVMFGKFTGGDIISNKKTYLLISALSMAKGNILEDLNDWISRKEFDRHAKIKAVTEIYNQLNVKSLTESRIKDFYQEALLSLGKVSVSKDRKGELSAFASQLMNRKK